MKRNIVFLTLIALTVLVSGCATESTTESPDVSPDDSVEASPDSVNDSDVREIVVSGGNFYFDSDNISVEAGETVRFVFENEGGTHDMRIPELEAGTSIISGGESESFTVTFDEEGEIEFICSVGTHAEQGMTGTITVS